ncbi:MAG: hypothetical protein WDZ69_01980 [Candidatus Pacearchaeota archaeon]
MYNYCKEVNDIRKKSFPEIKGAIWIIKIPFPIPGASVLWILPNLNLLAFSTKCKILSRDVLRGLIAHELSHFSTFQKGSWKGFWKFVFIATKEEAVKMEKATDRLAIKKGYGKELIATKKKAKQILTGTRWEHYLDNYLTEDEVRKYMKKE